MYRLFAIISVSIYLFVVLLYLLYKRKVAPLFPFKRLLKYYLRPPFRGPISNFVADSGHGWIASVPADLISDKEGVSSLLVLENGTPLRQAHASHEEIRKDGQGRFSHWGSQVYFSTSDNSSPRENGRTYEIAGAR